MYCIVFYWYCHWIKFFKISDQHSCMLSMWYFLWFIPKIYLVCLISSTIDIWQNPLLTSLISIKNNNRGKLLYSITTTSISKSFIHWGCLNAVNYLYEHRSYHNSKAMSNFITIHIYPFLTIVNLCARCSSFFSIHQVPLYFTFCPHLVFISSCPLQSPPTFFLLCSMGNWQVRPS